MTLTVAALTFAPAALAQSAGDDQYADPLAGQQSPSSPSGGEEEPSQPAPAPVAPAPAGPDTSTSDDDAGAGSTATAPIAGEALPRSGAEPGWIALCGLLLLAAGALLGRRARCA